MHEQFDKWIKENRIAEVECLVPDMNGVVRGKVLPANKFIQSVRDNTLRVPSSLYIVAITGHYPDEENKFTTTSDPDVVLKPDFESLCIAPGYRTPTAFVFADAYYGNGKPYEVAPRQVLTNILEMYAAKGWRPVVAPELEFYLTQTNTDPDFPLLPPAGRSGRPETSPQPYGLEAITEYEDLIENIYEHAELASLGIDTMIHESGTAQLEINFNHGDAIRLCDEVTVFKRIVRQVALKHGVYATFMAKPMEAQPGSAMHIHTSVLDKNGNNIFSDKNGGMSDNFRYFVGGLQKYLPQVTPLFAPNVNSFRRMRPHFSAPINLQWGNDNRSCGLRVPISDAQNRRIENRVPGADANPYLANAVSLVCGYLGIEEKIEPLPLMEGNAYECARTLPRTLDEALDRFNACEPVRKVMGKNFFETFNLIKAFELDAYEGVISSWERDHLLLKV